MHLLLETEGQPAAANPPPAQPSDGYQKVEGAQVAARESIPAPALVATAYGFIWLVVLIFVVRMARRATSLRRDLDELRARIDRIGATAAPDPKQPT